MQSYIFHQILQSNPHRNILHFLYHESNEENIYLIIEYCDNGDLEKYLKKRIKLDEETIRHFFKQIGINPFRTVVRGCNSGFIIKSSCSPMMIFFVIS